LDFSSPSRSHSRQEKKYKKRKKKNSFEAQIEIKDLRGFGAYFAETIPVKIMEII